MLDQSADPLAVLHIGLAPGHGLDVLGVQQPRLDPLGGLQQVEHRLPVRSCGLHADPGDPVLQQPVPQLQQAVAHRRERAHLVADALAGARHPDAHFDVRLAQIGASAPLFDHVHGPVPPSRPMCERVPDRMGPQDSKTLSYVLKGNNTGFLRSAPASDCLAGSIFGAKLKRRPLDGHPHPFSRPRGEADRPRDDCPGAPQHVGQNDAAP